MRDYFIRRFLLIPPTLIGITILVFFITRIVPGGPMERALAEISQVSAASSTTAGGSQALSEDQMNQLKAYYGFDKGPLEGYFIWLGKVLHGDLGTSTRYQEPVWTLVKDRMPISLFYAGATLLFTYGICIPLGIFKAIYHRSWFDNISSMLVFMGYAIPGYVLGALLLVFVASRWGIFPMGGFTSYGFEDMSLMGKIGDVLWHAVLPLCCYLIGSFALVTLLMKNHLMDTLAADYMRTATAKGIEFKKAVRRHALRNSLIPIATTFGQNMTLFVGGSFLIEYIFDIDGFGLLGFTAILDRDYPIVLGVLLLSSLLLMIGNIVSDVLVAAIDPRVRFD